MNKNNWPLRMATTTTTNTNFLSFSYLLLCDSLLGLFLGKGGSSPPPPPPFPLTIVTLGAYLKDMFAWSFVTRDYNKI